MAQAADPKFLLPLPLLIVPFGLIISGIATKSSGLRYAIFTVTVALLVFSIFFTTTGLPPLDYPIGNALSILIFLSSDFLLLTNSLSDLRRQGQVHPAESFSLLDRLKWATRLVVSPRMIGWTCEPQDVLPPRPSTTKTTATFALEQSAIAAVEILAVIAVDITMSFTPAFAAGGARLITHDWPWRSVYILEMGVGMSVCLDLSHRIWVLLLLATGQWSPSDFRSLFGSLAEGYTLRRYWGRTWHQLLRRKLTSHIGFLVRTLRLSRNSPYTSLFELYATFFLSGIIHYIGDYMCLRHWGSGSILFFSLQALAIHGESVFIGLARKTGLSIFNDSHWAVFWKVVGFVWVWQWFTWCLPILVDQILDRGRIRPLGK